jgi:hypothetical protein
LKFKEGLQSILMLERSAQNVPLQKRLEQWYIGSFVPRLVEPAHETGPIRDTM